MAKTPTTPASVASRLTDEDLEQFAIMSDSNAYICQTDVIQSDYYQKTAAVLRDYVRLRKLANAVKEIINDKDAVDAKVKDGLIVTAVGAVEQIKLLLAEAEKGEMK